MKFTFKNISERRIKELYNYKELPVVVGIPRFQAITDLPHEHIIVFTMPLHEEAWTFLATIKVNDKRCSVNIEVNKFTRDSSHPYGGVTELTCDIDTEDSIIYYFQELASKAITNYVLEGMSSDFKKEFDSIYKCVI